MSFYFNADELFQVGVQIEANGKAFYEAAAERAVEPDVRKLCRDLAGWESKHIELFEALRRGLPEEARQGSTFDPDSEMAGYIQAAADTHVFVKNKDMAALAASCRTAADILELAIGFEKDSVVFYSAMKGAVEEHEGREKVNAIIDEELRHIGILTLQKSKLAAPR